MGCGRNSLKIGTADLHKNRNCRIPEKPELLDSRETRTVGLHRNRNCRTTQEPELSGLHNFSEYFTFSSALPLYMELIINRIEQKAFCEKNVLVFYQAQKDFFATCIQNMGTQFQSARKAMAKNSYGLERNYLFILGGKSPTFSKLVKFQSSNAESVCFQFLRIFSPPVLVVLNKLVQTFGKKSNLKFGLIQTRQLH